MIGDDDMLVCLDCGHVFEEPNSWQETHGLDIPPYEQMSGCPMCSGSYIEAYECDACGEWINDDYFIVGDERFCNDCCQRVELGSE
jgi:hypothetical protein